jgi:hypothetical protein
MCHDGGFHDDLLSNACQSPGGVNIPSREAQRVKRMKRMRPVSTSQLRTTMSSVNASARPATSRRRGWSLYLAWKHHDNFGAGVLANAMVGGDNCHRGAVVGSLLGAANGVPVKWLEMAP